MSIPEQSSSLSLSKDGDASHAAGPADGAPVLRVQGLRAGYGAVTVVRPLDVSVPKGTVLAVLGPNGAGKTTLMATLAGLLPRIDGTVEVNGQVLKSGRPAVANRAGVILVPDDRALFTTLTTRENIVIARRQGAPTLDEVLDLFPALRARLTINAGMLSGGEQQMLAVARGLVQKPTVLLIDEMSMGLAPVIVEGLLPVVRHIADETGAVVILVEQHVRLALEVADRALVLVHGNVTLTGTAQELAANPAALEAAYLGEHEDASA
ncbi:MAG: putative transport protein ATP-binding component [Frankiales bacterium]|nr:putative transport protein ATP-binding component [Frankiales bacterium]